MPERMNKVMVIIKSRKQKKKELSRTYNPKIKNKYTKIIKLNRSIDKGYFKDF